MDCPRCPHSCFWVGVISETSVVWQCRAMCGNQTLAPYMPRPKPATTQANDGEPVRECTVPQSRGKYKEREWQGLGVQHEH